jgi:hypothetical protein
MVAQYGKMKMRDVIQPWAEMMVSYVGCHLAGGSKTIFSTNLPLEYGIF